MNSQQMCIGVLESKQGRPEIEVWSKIYFEKLEMAKQNIWNLKFQ